MIGSCEICGEAFHYFASNRAGRFCSIACRDARRGDRAREAVAFRLSGMAWPEVARRLGYANGRSARMSAMWVATDEQRRAMSGRIGLPHAFTPEQRAISARRRAAARRLLVRARGSDIEQDYIERMLRQATRCPLCGVRLTTGTRGPTTKHVDHIVPLAVGGRHVASNVRVICAACNLGRPRDGRDLVGVQISLDAVGDVALRSRGV